MNDNADLVSDVDCLGAIYPGEDAVFDGSGWTAVRDELLLEATAEDDAQLVEQTVVLFDTADEAVEFFDDVQGQHGASARRPKTSRSRMVRGFPTTCKTPASG